MKAPVLFTPHTIRGLTFPNRIFLSPMCQYSSTDGFANNWHLVHLGSRAVSGVGLIMTEAAAVCPEGRISPQDLGIWKDEHIAMLKTINEFIHSHDNVKTGIQIAHAGRKASAYRPWEHKYRYAVPNSEGGWEVVGPSAVAYDDKLKVPHELSVQEIHTLVDQFVDSAQRAVKAGFDLVEIHGAHGYLIHNFYSLKSNKRTDEYGGSFENRTRFLMEIATRVRAAIPDQMPLFVRLSSTDFVDDADGWKIEDTVKLSKMLKDVGVDVIDCSAGGNCAHQHIDVKPGYQVPYAERVKKDVNIPSIAVGLITEPHQANEIIEQGKADFVMLARAFLRDPYWTHTAARALGHKGIYVPSQYLRGITDLS